MRLYSLTNLYTGGIHAGIQTAHMVHELFYELNDDVTQRVLDTWAQEHKTIIVLQAGYHENIERCYYEFERLGGVLSLPYSGFRESKEALNNAWTAAGIVVPERIYAYRPGVSTYALTEFELELYNIISAYPLAK